MLSRLQVQPVNVSANELISEKPSDVIVEFVDEDPNASEISRIHAEIMRILKAKSCTATGVGLGTMIWVLIYYLYPFTESLGTSGYVLLSISEGVSSNVLSFPLSIKSLQIEAPDERSHVKDAFKETMKFVFLDSIYQLVYDTIIFLGKNESLHGEFVLNETATFSSLEIVFALLAFGLMFSLFDYLQTKCMSADAHMLQSLKVGPQYCIFYFNDYFFDVGDAPNTRTMTNLFLSSLVIAGADFCVNALPQVLSLKCREMKIKKNSFNPKRKVDLITNEDLRTPILIESKTIKAFKSLPKDILKKVHSWPMFFKEPEVKPKSEEDICLSAKMI